MVGLTDPDSNHSDHEDKQAGPDNVLGRADSVAGRCRGGKASERPPASRLAVLAEAAAVEPMLERGAGVRWRIDGGLLRVIDEPRGGRSLGEFLEGSGATNSYLLKRRITRA
jgi:hypothetical protein